MAILKAVNLLFYCFCPTTIKLNSTTSAAVKLIYSTLCLILFKL